MDLKQLYVVGVTNADYMKPWDVFKAYDSAETAKQYAWRLFYEYTGVEKDDPGIKISDCMRYMELSHDNCNESVFIETVLYEEPK